MNRPPLQTDQNTVKHFRSWILGGTTNWVKKSKIPHCISHFNCCDCCASDGAYVVDMHLNEIHSARQIHTKWINVAFFPSWWACFWVLLLFLFGLQLETMWIFQIRALLLLQIIWARLCFKTIRTCFEHQTTSENLIEKYFPIHTIYRYFIFFVRTNSMNSLCFSIVL